MNLLQMLRPGKARRKKEMAKLVRERDKARTQRDKLRSRMETLQKRLDSVLNERAELWNRVYRGQYNLSLPPGELQKRVAQQESNNFLIAGHRLAGCVRDLIRKSGRDPDALPAILDFGCGVGRVGRFLVSPGNTAVKYFGCDIDPGAISWCRENLAEVGSFQVSGKSPPLPYADHTFDFVLAISVFTHLPEEMQFQWLAELRRILKQGGLLLATVRSHGLPEEHREELAAKGFIYMDMGKTQGLPEFYLTTFHTADYVRDKWTEYFDILSFNAGVIGAQDAVLGVPK